MKRNLRKKRDLLEVFLINTYAESGSICTNSHTCSLLWKEIWATKDIGKERNKNEKKVKL